MSNDSRRAALMLHAMSDEDRAWALGAMAQPARERARALLAELHTLGIPREPSLLRQALARKPRRLPAVAPERECPIRDASIGSLIEMTERETAFTVACLLAADVWPWEREYARRIEPRRWRDIQAARKELAQSPLPPALRSVILELARDGLARSRGQSAPPERIAGAMPWVRRKLEELIGRSR